ncbi:MAG TPA: hypothetical protein VE175_09305 [Woeseiaceae bacterium]|nr:hypothetical protein [Woeseiaceae bacterium]
MNVRLLRSILAERRFLATALVSLLVYVVLYLTAMGYLIVTEGGGESFYGFQVARHWQEMVFRLRGPFVFEPVALLRVGSLALLLSIPNLALGALLGLLVGANVAVSYYGFRRLGMRGIRGVHALIGTLPALLSGAACCVPTLILVLGLQLTAALAAVWSVLVPASAVLLVISLWWSLHRIGAELTCTPEETGVAR